MMFDANAGLSAEEHEALMKLIILYKDVIKCCRATGIRLPICQKSAMLPQAVGHDGVIRPSDSSRSIPVVRKNASAQDNGLQSTQRFSHGIRKKKYRDLDDIVKTDHGIVRERS